MADKQWLDARKQVSLYLVHDSPLMKKLDAWMENNKHRNYAPAITEILELFLSGHKIDDVPDDRLGDKVLEMNQRVEDGEARFRSLQGQIDSLQQQVEMLNKAATLSGLTKAVGELEALKKDAGGLTRAVVAKKLGYESLSEAARKLGFRNEDDPALLKALAEKMGYRVEGEGRLAKFYPPL